MKSTRITRSKAKSLAPGPSAPPTFYHPHPPSIIVTEPLDDSSSVLIQSPVHPVTSHEMNRDTPLHQFHQPSLEATPEPASAPILPAIDPQLQAAMMAMVEVKTCQFQAQLEVPLRARRRRAHDRDDEPAPRTRVKTNDPEPYDRNDPAKLRAFLSQGKRVFRARPDDFEDVEVKITYTVSWLKSTAQRWYEPNLALAEYDLPECAVRWDAFEEVLQTTFGEQDPINPASHKLDNLRMQGHHHITRYNVVFQEYATITGFDERLLYAKYYKGLAPRIKDGLVCSGRPDTPAELRTQAMNLDVRYWEGKDEVKYQTASNSSSQASKSSSGPSHATPSSSSPTKSKLSPSKSQSPSPAAASSSSKAKKPDLSKVLGLCIICASKDHMSDRCPSRKDAQRRAAQVHPISEDGGPASEAEYLDSLN